jgi:leucyl aminopeptidase
VRWSLHLANPTPVFSAYAVLALFRMLNLTHVQTSDKLWEQLRVAGETEYDRFWRMPLDDDYNVQIQGSNADLQNVCP